MNMMVLLHPWLLRPAVITFLLSPTIITYLMWPADMNSDSIKSVSDIGFVLFISFFVFRYLRFFVGCFAYYLYKPKPIMEKPAFTPGDVTVIIPTTARKLGELIECVQNILTNNPHQVFIVTSEANVDLVKTEIQVNISTSKVTVLGVDQLDKRDQILRAMPLVKTSITVLADDDVVWPQPYLPYLLAIFEDPQVGAGGTRQRVKRDDNPSAWNFLGISYLERRVFNNCATNAIDGSISTLSGRTAAYRTDLINSAEFAYYFSNDTFGGQRLNSDDDKCLTRYVYSKGRKIVLQFDPRSTIETTVEPDKKYLDQCMRWARAHWRGNLTVMNKESYWRSLKYFWGCYYIYVGQFQSPALLIDGLLYLFLWFTLWDKSTLSAVLAYCGLTSWIAFTKIAKLIPHFRKYPSDIKFIPLSIAFSYYHGCLNVWSLLSLQITAWGSQNLEQLERSRVQAAELEHLLRGQLPDPTPGQELDGDDYFEAHSMEERQSYGTMGTDGPYLGR